MRYKPQRPLACYAAALWQIGVITDEALFEYEEKIAPFIGTHLESKLVSSWVKTHCPKAPDFYQFLEIPSGDESLSPNLCGKGVVVITYIQRQKTWSHAISFEDGKVLDPGLGISEPMIWEEWKNKVLERHPLRKFKKWRVIRLDEG